MISLTLATAEDAERLRLFRGEFTREELAEGERMMASVTPEQEAAVRAELTDEGIARMMAKIDAMPPPTITVRVLVPEEWVPKRGAYGWWEINRLGAFVESIVHEALATRLGHEWVGETAELCDGQAPIVYADREPASLSHRVLHTGPILAVESVERENGRWLATVTTGATA